MARVKHIVGWISVVLLVVTLASIWMLTEQNVEQTSSLSESTARAVEGQSVSVQPETAGETQAGDAAGDAGLNDWRHSSRPACARSSVDGCQHSSRRTYR